MTQEAKITFGELRDMVLRGVLKLAAGEGITEATFGDPSCQLVLRADWLAAAGLTARIYTGLWDPGLRTLAVRTLGPVGHWSHSALVTFGARRHRHWMAREPARSIADQTVEPTKSSHLAWHRSALKAMAAAIGLGNKVVLVFADDQKRFSVRVSDGVNDLEKGRLSASSPLSQAILGAEEGDEVELPLEEAATQGIG